MGSLLSTTATYWQLPLRFCLFFVFWMHGSQKIFGMYDGPGLQGFADYVATLGVPMFLGYLAAFAEFLGSLGMLFGFLTRIAAFGIFCTMAFAVFRVNCAGGFFMNWAVEPGKGHGYEYSMTLMLVALALMIGGAGRLSFDRRLSTRRGRAS